MSDEFDRELAAARDGLASAREGLLTVVGALAEDDLERAQGRLVCPQGAGARDSLGVALLQAGDASARRCAAGRRHAGRKRPTAGRRHCN